MTIEVDYGLCICHFEGATKHKSYLFDILFSIVMASIINIIVWHPAIMYERHCARPVYETRTLADKYEMH